MGTAQYEPIARRHRVPIVVTGFEPVDILAGVLAALEQLEQGRAEVENLYARAVNASGNLAAQAMLSDVFRVVTRRWRGIAELPESGLALSPAYEQFDASLRFDSSTPARSSDADSACQSGLVLLGRLKPTACPAFGTRCTPEHPLGATMVSSEGACAAYFRYRRDP
jgi:hydrogenase expression/formation protein HypD